MFPVFLAINGLIIGFISYQVIFNPDQLATGINQRLTSFAIRCILGLILLTGLSAFFWYLKQMPGLASCLYIGSWALLLYGCYIFLARQKWM